MPDAPDRHAWLADEFERHRPRLRGVAYRMLGSVTEADDAVQEAWIRLQRGDPGGTEDLRGWLTVTVGRICLDMLRTRTSRRETYVGTWLPEPIVTPADPRHEPEPGGRHDPRRVGRARAARRPRPPHAARAARLRPARRVRDPVRPDRAARRPDARGHPPAGEPRPASRPRGGARADADLAVQRQVVDAFVAAARAGDIAALLEILDPDVVFRADGGGHGPLARPPLQGAEAVARRRAAVRHAVRGIRPPGDRQRRGRPDRRGCPRRCRSSSPASGSATAGSSRCS